MKTKEIMVLIVALLIVNLSITVLLVHYTEKTEELLMILNKNQKGMYEALVEGGQIDPNNWGASRPELYKKPNEEGFY